MPFRGHLAPIEFPRWWLFYWVLCSYDRHHFSLFLRLLCDSAFKINPRLSQAPPGPRETSEPPFPSSCTRDLHSGGLVQGQIQKTEMCLVEVRGLYFFRNKAPGDPKTHPWHQSIPVGFLQRPSCHVRGWSRLSEGVAGKMEALRGVCRFAAFMGT